MSYFSFTHRVPELSAMEPWVLARAYGQIIRVPPMRTAHRRFVVGALTQGVTQGYGLDLGTGPGFVAVEMSRRSPDLRMVGLDLAVHMVEQARHRAVHAGLNGSVLWPQADGHFLPFADDSFDLIVSSFSLHHWEDPLLVFDEIARVLAPGGRYFIADVCREVSFFQRCFAYASILTVSLPFGSYFGYGGYYESVRAGYTRVEAEELLARSELPPGEVRLDSTCLMPILTVASKGTD